MFSNDILIDLIRISIIAQVEVLRWTWKSKFRRCIDKNSWKIKQRNWNISKETNVFFIEFRSPMNWFGADFLSAIQHTSSIQCWGTPIGNSEVAHEIGVLKCRSDAMINAPVEKCRRYYEKKEQINISSVLPKSNRKRVVLRINRSYLSSIPNETDANFARIPSNGM